MRKQFFFAILFASCLFFFPSSDYGQGGRPVPPGIREADKQTSPPIEAPAKVRQKPTDAAVLRQEAQELANLSAAIPSQMDQINQGKIPKELSDKLKRIEKLARHLRSEIAP